MFNINNWRQPIYKNDVKNVLIYGIIVTILGAVLAGLIDATLNNFFRIGVSFSLLICSLSIGFAVKKGYEEYHILYPVLALVFMIHAIFISQLAYYVGILGIQSLGTILTSPSFYLSVLTLPINYLLIMIDTGFNGFYLLYLILNIIFYVLAFYSVYKIAKGNRR